MRASERSRERGGGTDPESLEYWLAIGTGDFVGLRDGEAFEARLASSPGSGETDYEVGEIRDFSVLGRASPTGKGLGSYRLVELKAEGKGPLYLALVRREDGFERRLYFVPEGIVCGSRDELVDSGQTWLFLPPPDPEDFKSSELEYAPYPGLPPLDGRSFVFARRGPPLYAEALDTGAPSILVEYEAEAESGGELPANPLLLAIEEGWMRPDGSEPEEGGYVTTMLGKILRPGDLEVFPGGGR